MEKQLDYVRIEGGLGGVQDWLKEPMMRLGGCAAVCACDSCLYLARRGYPQAYPGAVDRVARSDYVRFAQVMKPYLRPRWSGIDRTDIYTAGLGRYWADRGVTGVTMTDMAGGTDPAAALTAVQGAIDGGLPVACLILNHRDPRYADYVWHWFMLAGYRQPDQVWAVTYGQGRWLPFPALWRTGYQEKGGLVFYHCAPPAR